MKTVKTLNVTREQWLREAVAEIRNRLQVAVAIPDVNVSCSWPGGGSPKKRIGECWPRKASAANTNEVFISPKLDDPAHVVQILTHELAHAVDDCVHGHKAAFVAVAKLMGCEGKPTQMTPPADWAASVAASVIDRVGAFPHRKLDKAASGQKVQKSRQVKCECPACGAIWRMSQQWIDAAENGMWCPVCGEVHQPGGGEDHSE